VSVVTGNENITSRLLSIQDTTFLDLLLIPRIISLNTNSTNMYIIQAEYRKIFNLAISEKL
jgi:hypothetical protein